MIEVKIRKSGRTANGRKFPARLVAIVNNPANIAKYVKPGYELA